MTCNDSAVSNDNKDENICFSKAMQDTCSEIGQVLQCSSSVVGPECIVDIENGVDEVKISFEITERDCRICMLSLDSESKIAIELGCSCKNELALAHQHCAEQWFGKKGNKICEICKSIAQNVAAAPNHDIPKVTVSPTSESRALSLICGNILFACICFAFIVFALISIVFFVLMVELVNQYS